MSANHIVTIDELEGSQLCSGGVACVLWLHGYTMRSHLWHRVWAELPDSICNIGMDWPGHGIASSEMPEYSLCDLAVHIGEAAIRNNVRHLVGLSFGSIIALQVVAMLPGCFATVTLGAPGLTGANEEPGARERYYELAYLYATRGRGRWLTDMWLEGPPGIFLGAKRRPWLLRELRDAIDLHSWAELRNHSMQRLVAYRQIDNIHMFERISSSVLLVTGEDELVSFRDSATLLRGVIPVCRSMTIPGTGHLCLLEDPFSAAEIIWRHISHHVGDK